jgi:aryl-alcohol dehydrogenase-like predicted oxidoreductase
MKGVERLYFGTWQFGGQFTKMSRLEIISLVEYALQKGVLRFDTAMAYGSGKVEEMLGEILPREAVIVTKVPTIKKPVGNLCGGMEEYYPEDFIRKSLDASLLRLRRNRIDTLLLHNWHSSWNNGSGQVFSFLEKLKTEGLVKRIGISFPDGSNCFVGENIVERIDVVEAPYNIVNNEIVGHIPKLLADDKEVILRSIFLQGILLRNKIERADFLSEDIRLTRTADAPERCFAPQEILSQVSTLGTSVVIGMTTLEQVDQNISFFVNEVKDENAKR